MPKPCSRCGRSYGADTWGELRVVERITEARVRDYVTVWPKSDLIEVRTCTCGQALALRVRCPSELASPA